MKARDRAAQFLRAAPAVVGSLRPRSPVPKEPRTAPFMVIRSSAQESVRDASLAQFWLACGLWLAFQAGALHRGRSEAVGVLKGMVIGGGLAVLIFAVWFCLVALGVRL